MSDLVNEDRKKFEDQMQNYQIHLEELKTVLNENESANANVNNISNIISAPKKFTFLTDDIKILSYKQNAGTNVVEKKNNNDKVEIKKLLKFTKNAQLNKKKSHNMTDNTVGNNSPSVIAPNITISRPSSKVELRPIEKGNTIQIVKSEAMNSLLISEIITKKQSSLEDCLKDQELPKLEDYDKILMRNITTQKIAQQTSVLNPKDRETSNQPSGKNEVYEEYNKKYEEKKPKWEMEDIQQQNLEKLEKERRKDTKAFLSKIKKRPRYTQQFVDQYSIRDENINKNIMDLNKFLGKQSYDKKKLNKKIDDFFLEMEKKTLEEKEKLNKIEEEKEVVSPNEEIIQIMKKKLVSEDDVNVKFGEKENEIVLALVNSTKVNEMSAEEKMKENYKDFLHFKDKVIKRERSKLSQSMDNIQGFVRTDTRRNSKVKEVSETNLLKRTPEEIIGILRRNSLHDQKNISMIRKSTKTGKY